MGASTTMGGGLSERQRPGPRQPRRTFNPRGGVRRERATGAHGHRLHGLGEAARKHEGVEAQRASSAET
eukprot:5522786-Pyramimonas_sp.AAC.1